MSKGVRYTPQQFQDYLKRETARLHKRILAEGVGSLSIDEQTTMNAMIEPGQADIRPSKLLSARKEEDMNLLEQAFFRHLQREECRLVFAHKFKLRLANATWYTPDFVVLHTMTPIIDIYETKGWMRDDAAVKLKVVAEQYFMFNFYLVTRVKGGGFDIKPVGK